MARPNIVVFFTDQQRWDTCGCYGQRLEITPNLDRMAAGGVRFANAFTCQPVCGPTRAALQTGCWPSTIGCHTNHRLLPVDRPTIAKALRASGYEVGYLGKWHLASCGPRGGEDDYRTRPVPPERRGGYEDFWLASDTLEFTSHAYDGHMFDAAGERREFPEGRYRADAETDWLLEYLETRDGERPFFLFASYIEPHHQNDHGHYEGPDGSKQRFADFDVPGDLAGTEGDWRAEFPDYLGCCRSLDENLGRVRARLDELGLAEDTLLVFTSDHGSHFRTRNGEYKRSCHEGSIHVPMVVEGPGFRGGRTVGALVSLIDLPRTLLAAAGVDPLPDMRGRDLARLVAGETAATWGEEVFVQVSESQVGRALRTPRWKYGVAMPQEERGLTIDQPPSSERYREECLYDLAADPHERHNLIVDSDHDAVRLDLRRRLLARIEEAEGLRPKIVSWDGPGLPAGSDLA